jgi:hypothetical protein
MALVQPGRLRLKGVGTFEAWICAACGLVEWYVVDVGSVAGYVDGDRLRWVRREGEGEGEERRSGELPPPGEGLEAARQQVVALGAGLDRLLEEVFNERGALDRTMRGRRRCPLCGGAELLRVREVLDRADGPSRLPMALEQPRRLRGAGAGLFTAWICAGCGAAEWYVPDLSGVDVDGERRRLHRGTPGAALPPPLGPAQLLAAAATEAALERWVEALSRRVEVITARVDELLARVDRLPAGPASLSAGLGCPACAGHEVLHASTILDRSEAGRDEMALIQRRWFRLRGEGTFTAWICTACGLVEWRIPDIASVKIDGKKLRLVEGLQMEPPGPYR